MASACVLAAACGGAQVQLAADRLQRPLYQYEGKHEVSLVSVTGAPGVAPEVLPKVKAALVEYFARGEGLALKDQTAIGTPMTFVAGDANKPFAASAPVGLAATLAPLSLGAYVVTTSAEGEAELVLTLWTREGLEVFTQWVRVDPRTADLAGSVKSAPDQGPLLADMAASDPKLASAAAGDPLATALARAVGVSLWALFPHTLPMQITLEQDGATEKGVNLMMQKKYRDAADAFRAASEQDPDHVGALYDLGIATALLGDDEKAAEHLGKAAEMEKRAPITTERDAARARAGQRKPLALAVAGGSLVNREQAANAEAEAKVRAEAEAKARAEVEAAAAKAAEEAAKPKKETKEEKKKRLADEKEAARLKAEEDKKKKEEEVRLAREKAEREKAEADKRVAEAKAAEEKRIADLKAALLASNFHAEFEHSGFLFKLEQRPGVADPNQVAEFVVEIAEMLAVAHPRYGNLKPAKDANLQVVILGPDGSKAARRLHPMGDAGLFGFHFTPAGEGRYSVHFTGTTVEGKDVDASMDFYAGVFPFPGAENGVKTGRRPSGMP